MNEYKELIKDLNTSLIKLDEYEDQLKSLQNSLESKTTKTNDLFKEQIEQIEKIKSSIDQHIIEYNNIFKNETKNLENKLDEIATDNIKQVKLELTNQISEVMSNVSKEFEEQFDKLHENRKVLVEKLTQIVDVNKNEGTQISQLNDQIAKQNEYLKTINDESKAYINQYFEEIKSLKEELALIKENFELKYVFNGKRIFLTTIASLILIAMIIIVGMSAVFMFLYYTRYIIFPNREITLLYGILLTLLGFGLIGILIIILVKPPTFLKVKKGNKGEK